MPASKMWLIKRCAEFRPAEKEEIRKIPGNTRGIYALLRCRRKYKDHPQRYDVVYVGMAGAASAGIRGRLKAHFQSKKKRGKWSHFSIFEVWDNVTEEQVAELEGLLRHIYRKDTRANRLARQKSYAKLKQVRVKKLEQWQ